MNETNGANPLIQRAEDVVLRNWRIIVPLMWLAYAAWIIFNKWGQIRGFALPDTDDNLRMAQVRALLAGQNWFDLTQYRFDPVHGGANIHWSRLTDLPIAGLVLVARPFLGGADAERFAVTLAPLLPLLPMMAALALTTHRLVGSRSWPLPLIALLGAYSTMGMFGPLRIDHHGWQLAFLAIAVSGMADPKRARGGAITGIASGLSLAIGLEMMIYLALFGAACVLMWVADRDQRQRLGTYAAAMVATTGAAFLIFASNANRLAVCDALSPVWLSDAAVAGAGMTVLAALRLERWTARLGGAVVAGLTVAGFHAIAWPGCLERLEGVSPQATALWLDHVREARPFYLHNWRNATLGLALPVTALAGWGLLLWRSWTQVDDRRDLFARTLAVALPAIVALALLSWQMRAAPAAQLMALPGTAALIMLVAAPWFKSPRLLLHVGAVLVVLLALGALVPVALKLVPKALELAQVETKPNSMARVGKANGQCPSLAALAPVHRQPRGIVFSFVDLGPRIIAVTRHDAIAGPYHRNDQAIADIMTAFRGDEAQARRIITSYGSHYLLVCPNMSTATIFQAETPKGFYMQLIKGDVPAWLTPIDLGPNSPFLMWKVKR